MKPGDLVLLQGSMWSSYEHQGEAGLLLDTDIKIVSSTQGDMPEFSQVMWNDGSIGLCKTSDLKCVNEHSLVEEQ